MTLISKSLSLVRKTVFKFRTTPVRKNGVFFLLKLTVSSNLLVISTYPSKNTTHTGGGLAIYTKNTLLAIKKANKYQKITVLANVIDIPEEYSERGVHVIRCWDRSVFKLYYNLTKQILKQKNTKNILLGFEFAAYGDFFTTSLMPFFLLLLKLLGKKTVSVIHQVIPNLISISVHTGLSKNKRLPLYNKLLILYFKFFGFASYRVVTLEKTLSERFNRITNNSKAIFIPHGLYPKSILNQRHAQSLLNLSYSNYYVLSFGYLSQYKGTDILVKAFQKPLYVKKKKVILILAGGESPTQGQKGHYKHFYQDLYESIANNSNIIHTGFVPDKQVKSYFSASDLCIFPYRTFMSASGPLSLAISHQKPFLVSQSLSNYSKNSFKNNSRAIRKAITKALGDKNIIKDMVKHSQELAKTRNFNDQGLLYLNTFNN